MIPISKPKSQIFQNCQTKPSKLNLPNQTYQTKPTKPNLPDQTYQIKPAKPNLLSLQDPSNREI